MIFVGRFRKGKKIRPSIITDSATNTPFHAASSSSFTSGLIEMVTAPGIGLLQKTQGVSKPVSPEPRATPSCCYLLTSYRLFSSTDDLHTAVTWLSKCVLPPPPPAFYYYIDNKKTKNSQDKSDLLQIGPGPQTLPAPLPPLFIWI